MTPRRQWRRALSSWGLAAGGAAAAACSAPRAAQRLRFPCCPSRFQDPEGLFKGAPQEGIIERKLFAQQVGSFGGLAGMRLVGVAVWCGVDGMGAEAGACMTLLQPLN